jgi:hypothetical protein
MPVPIVVENHLWIVSDELRCMCHETYDGLKWLTTRRQPAWYLRKLLLGVSLGRDSILILRQLLILKMLMEFVDEVGMWCLVNLGREETFRRGYSR